MIVLRTPEGLDRARRWSTASRSTGTWRSHQVPLSGVKDNAEHLRLLEEWLRSYRPEELFDDDGRAAPSWSGAPTPRATCG